MNPNHPLGGPMTQMIIKAKLQKQSLPLNLVVKDEIIEQIKTSRIIIISAGAGTGKSTLVSHWLDTQDVPFIWFSIDDWDNTLAQFLHYLAAGLVKIDGIVSNQMLQMLESRLTIDEDSLMRAFISILQSMQSPLIIVLDDYHHIYEPKIHVFTRMLIEHLPPSLKICIISREDPPLPLGRLRLQSSMTELRMVDLMFTKGEAEALLTSQLKRALTQKQLDQIYLRTEGWVSGLLLTAYTMQSIDDIDQFVQSFGWSQRYVMDYLLEEVLERQSDQMKIFLLSTSIFEYFTAQMCDEILSFSSGASAEIIENLVKSNSFMIVLEGDDCAYRYHHLFRALLLKRFDVDLSQDRVHLYKSAGDWYLRNGQYKEAIDKYLAGGCFELAAGLAEQIWSEMDLSLESASWLEMVKKMPKTLLEKSPVLLMGYGWALLDSGDVMRSLPWFESAKLLYERWILDAEEDLIMVRNRDEMMQMPATLMSAEAYIAAISGNYEDLFLKTDTLKRLADVHSYKRQWQIKTFLATSHWGSGELSEALDLMIHVADETRGLLNPLILNSFKSVISELYIQMGQLTKAEFVIRDAMEEVKQEGIVPVMMATYYLYLAQIAAYRGTLDMAYEYLETSKAYGHQFEFMDWRYKYNTILSRLYLAEDLWDSAKLCVEEGKQHIFNNPIPESITLEDMEIWLKLSKERDPHALEVRIASCLETYDFFDINDGGQGFNLKNISSMRITKLPAYVDEMKIKILMRYSPVEIFSELFGPLCGKLIVRASVQKRWLSVIEFTLLKIRFESSRPEREALMASAIKLSEIEGIKLPFMEFGQVQHDTLRSSLHIKSPLANQKLSEPLSVRELEILELIAKGMSNQEIANTLFIALSTVKSYNNNLFGKLEVSRRTEAVAKATALGLV